MTLFLVCLGEYRGKREIKAFMRYFRAKESIERENAFFRVYAARGLQLITEYTAGFVGGKQGLANYEDALHPKPQQSAEEIAAEVIIKAGLKLNEST